MEIRFAGEIFSSCLTNIIRLRCIWFGVLFDIFHVRNFLRIHAGSLNIRVRQFCFVKRKVMVTVQLYARIQFWTYDNTDKNIYTSSNLMIKS